MRKRLVKEYDFLPVPGGFTVRVFIFKGDYGFWGYWQHEELQESTEHWYPSIRDAKYMIEQHATRMMQTKK